MSGDERAVSHQEAAIATAETCWGFLDDEVLQAEADDVVEYWLDAAHPTPIAELPETIEIHEFRRRIVVCQDGSRQLEDLLEKLDEEYGNMEGYIAPTPAMKAAAESFVEAVVAEYHVWQCEPTGRTETVNVLDWVKANRPGWLTETP